MVLLAITTRFHGKDTIGEGILHEQGLAFVGDPAAISLVQAQGVMHATQGTRPIGGAQGDHALQFVIEEDGAEFGVQLFGDVPGDGFQGLIQVNGGIADAVDALQGLQALFHQLLHVLLFAQHLVHDGLVATRECHEAELLKLIEMGCGSNAQGFCRFLLVEDGVTFLDKGINIGLQALDARL